eukprot:12505048-Alexandrium_andersonii.AAC.1
MSASLVGSEMCIRDRLRTVSGGLRNGRGKTGRPQRLARQRRARLRVTEPVSYTHLTLPTICSV